LFFVLLIGCGATEQPQPTGAEEKDMGSAIYAGETLNVGTETVIDSMSPAGRYGVVFEDDSETGYFYALDTSKGDDPIVDALHIYNVGSVADKDVPSTVQIVWSADGLKAALVINRYPHAVFDFEAKRGYCRTGVAQPSKEWTRYDSRCDDSALELFK